MNVIKHFKELVLYTFISIKRGIIVHENNMNVSKQTSVTLRTSPGTSYYNIVQKLPRRINDRVKNPQYESHPELSKTKRAIEAYLVNLTS